MTEVVRLAWEATDRLCSKRLQPFLSDLIPVLRRYGDRFISAEAEVQVYRMSPSTMDRLLCLCRRLGGGVGPCPAPGQEACLSHKHQANGKMDASTLTFSEPSQQRA